MPWDRTDGAGVRSKANFNAKVIRERCLAISRPVEQERRARESRATDVSPLVLDAAAGTFQKSEPENGK